MIDPQIFAISLNALLLFKRRAHFSQEPIGAYDSCNSYPYSVNEARPV